MPARLLSPTDRNLRLAAAALRRGRLVALPTETVYGLAADALDARACRRIFTAKRRPAHDPLIVHVAGLREAAQLAELNPAARILARTFWPGPLTLVLPKRPVVPAIVTSGHATVALRSPAHPVARRLLRLAGIPLAAPSANPFGYVSPTTAAHVQDGLGDRIEFIIDGGPCGIGVESTIVDASDPRRLRVLRPGVISAAALRAALRRGGLSARVAGPAKDKTTKPVAPGMLDQHYSPRRPLSVVARLTPAIRRAADESTALIFWRRPTGARRANESWLSTRGSPYEASRNLYARLREADAGGFRRIVVEAPPAGSGAAGLAIADRLRRAAAK